MKAFVVLAAVVACAYAKPQVIFSGYSGLQGLTLGGIQYATGPSIISAPAVTYAAPAIIAPAVTKTQYHAQDELGQASYGYAHPGQAHAAVRDAFGNVRGSYAYVNPEGKEVRVEYVADGGGFRVASNALPVGPEVPAAPAVPVLVGPEPVQDTPEVAEAKAAHAKLVAEAVARNAEADKADEAKEAEKPQSRRKRGIIAAAAPIALASPAVHTIQVAPALHTLQTVQLAAAPAITYSAIAPAVVAAAQPVREATLTKVVNTPGHAVSYRVD
ncbi:Cuticle protein 7 [Orchesella cincta]|uniref:Cuticle protein 7 n=1 Tax=Orchesella cincta TaxID=48709 RepID=A0A1D2NEJ9_ORCCI|nr:Cuticle protein 7 [Orchesella cincta]